MLDGSELHAHGLFGSRRLLPKAHHGPIPIVGLSHFYLGHAVTPAIAYLQNGCMDRSSLLPSRRHWRELFRQQNLWYPEPRRLPRPYGRVMTGHLAYRPQPCAEDD